MVSLYSALYTLVLFSELSSLTVAMPSTKAEDNVTEQDDIGFLLRDEPMSERAVVSPLYRRSVLDNNAKDEDGSPKIIFISDMKLRGHSIRGMNPTFTRSLPALSDQNMNHDPAEQSLKIYRRNTDLDILRCMIGRVYRPCWEV
ncbi:pro-MCH [Notolabrus celidotus]|uniref:pro-MCH n=1 Tax=Notolabrus celidotus TaxID=1203425 RepID=UPI00148F65A6|nr:pro-MCH [Notolabrus celidotus]